MTALAVDLGLLVVDGPEAGVVVVRRHGPDPVRRQDEGVVEAERRRRRRLRQLLQPRREAPLVGAQQVVAGRREQVVGDVGVLRAVGQARDPLGADVASTGFDAWPMLRQSVPSNNQVLSVT